MIVVLFLIGYSVSKVGQQAAFTANILDDLSQPVSKQQQQVSFATDISTGPTTSSLNPRGLLLGLEKLADGLDSPVFVTHAGDGGNRLFVVGKRGTIHLLPEGELF